MIIHCLTCKHCVIDFGSTDYSPETPGEKGEWKCLKGIWELSYNDSKYDMHIALKHGEHCGMFQKDHRHG